MRAPFLAVVAIVFALATPAVADAKADCEALPKSALKTRSCNPQAECRASIPNRLRGQARERRERDCERLPNEGVCHGPDRYDPQADCRTTQRRR